MPLFISRDSLWAMLAVAVNAGAGQFLVRGIERDKDPTRLREHLIAMWNNFPHMKQLYALWGVTGTLPQPVLFLILQSLSATFALSHAGPGTLVKKIPQFLSAWMLQVSHAFYVLDYRRTMDSSRPLVWTAAVRGGEVFRSWPPALRTYGFSLIAYLWMIVECNFRCRSRRVIQDGLASAVLTAASALRVVQSTAFSSIILTFVYVQSKCVREDVVRTQNGVKELQKTLSNFGPKQAASLLNQPGARTDLAPSNIESRIFSTWNEMDRIAMFSLLNLSACLLVALAHFSDELQQLQEPREQLQHNQHPSESNTATPPQLQSPQRPQRPQLNKSTSKALARQVSTLALFFKTFVRSGRFLEALRWSAVWLLISRQSRLLVAALGDLSRELGKQEWHVQLLGTEGHDVSGVVGLIKLARDSIEGLMKKRVALRSQNAINSMVTYTFAAFGVIKLVSSLPRTTDFMRTLLSSVRRAFHAAAEGRDEALVAGRPSDG